MMALQSQECVKDSTKFEETELSRRESARIKDKRRAEKELQVRRRVELLNEHPVVAGDGGRRKRIKHCYSRRASVKNGHGEVEKISQGFEVGDKPMNRSLEAENMAVGENGAASTFEKSDYAKVKETLRVFNKHYLHFVQVSLFSFVSAIIDSS
jgi:euchromatic histone-lysine N-methyltransferase